MLGYEIHYYDGNDFLDGDDPIFNKDQLKSKIPEIKTFFSEGHHEPKILINENEYWGNEISYDFNDTYGYTECDSFSRFLEELELSPDNL